MEPRLSLVTLSVADLARARAFYIDGLGWPASSASTDDIVFIQIGGLALALFPLADFAAELGVRVADARPAPRIVLAHNVRAEADVAAVLTTAERAGGRIVKPATKAHWGGTSGYFTDPDEHHWEVAFNPFFPLGDDGALLLP